MNIKYIQIIMIVRQPIGNAYMGYQNYYFYIRVRIKNKQKKSSDTNINIFLNFG